MTTFSQIIDKLVKETGRPDLLVDITSYCNQTLRELHFEPTRGNAAYYKDNLKEIKLTATSEVLSWTIPKVSVYQGIAAVRYDCVFDVDRKPIWAEEMAPGYAMNSKKYYYYRAGTNVSFSGFGGVNATISLSWFEYVPNLKYYAVADRPATYDDVDGWTYKNTYDVDDTTRQNAQDLCTNWLLLRWSSVIEEGLRAKVYKRVSDDSRAKTSYSMYTTLRQGLYSAEVAVLGG
jgi:hypothetical protein